MSANKNSAPYAPNAQEHSMTLLNETGDITLTWSDDQDAKIRKMIQKKMDEGYSFFRIESRFCGLVKKKIPVTSADRLKGNEVTLTDKEAARVLGASDMKAVFRDPDAAELFADGRVQAAELESMDEPLETTERLKDANEVMRSQSVAVRPVMGG